MKTRLCVMFIVAAPLIGLATPADAMTREPIKAVSRTKLASACKLAGGQSYGSRDAYGCAVQHKDGSADIVDCTPTKCVHTHLV